MVYVRHEVASCYHYQWRPGGWGARAGDTGPDIDIDQTAPKIVSCLKIIEVGMVEMMLNFLFTYQGIFLVVILVKMG